MFELSSISVSTPLRAANTLVVCEYSLRSPPSITLALLSFASTDLMNVWTTLVSSHEQRVELEIYRGNTCLADTLVNTTVNRWSGVSFGGRATKLRSELRIDCNEPSTGCDVPSSSEGFPGRFPCSVGRINAARVVCEGHLSVAANRSLGCFRRTTDSPGN